LRVEGLGVWVLDEREQTGLRSNQSDTSRTE
jgi:hypothetical protein